MNIAYADLGLSWQIAFQICDNVSYSKSGINCYVNFISFFFFFLYFLSAVRLTAKRCEFGA